MSVLNFIASNWDSIAAVGGIVGGYIFHRGKKARETDRWDLIEKLAKQAFPRLLKDARLYDDAYVRRTIGGAIWAGLDRLGIKRSTALAKLVDEAVEYAIGELATALIDYQLGQFKRVQGETVDILKAATEPAS